jgi:hypothetical protein
MFSYPPGVHRLFFLSVPGAVWFRRVVVVLLALLALYTLHHFTPEDAIAEVMVGFLVAWIFILFKAKNYLEVQREKKVERIWLIALGAALLGLSLTGGAIAFIYSFSMCNCL